MPTDAEIDARLGERLSEPKQYTADGVTVVNDDIGDLLKLAEANKAINAQTATGGNPFKMVGLARVQPAYYRRNPV